MYTHNAVGMGRRAARKECIDEMVIMYIVTRGGVIISIQ